uniref:condensation domain-containing protein n=1 Tax=Nocardia suismassiliense TaxID=2077092 RepID=UPI003F491229
MDQYPLSSRQKDPNGLARSPRHVVALALRIKGELHVDALQGALDEVVERHEALRTRLHYDEQDGTLGFQEVLPPQPVPLTVHDTPLPGGRTRDEMAIDVHVALHDAELSFLVTPSLRAELYRFDDQDALLTLVTHHLFSDGWSSDVLRREIAACYRARVTGVPHPLPSPVPYRMFVSWQQEFLRSEKAARCRRFWGRELAGVEMYTMPADRAHGPETQAPRSEVENFSIDPGKFAEVAASAARLRCGVWHVFLAAFMVLAEKISGRTDITLLTVNNGRQDEKFYQTVGFFTDFVPIRLEFGDCANFRDLMLLARRASADSQQHRMSFDSILEIFPDLMKGAFDPLTLLPSFNYVRSPRAEAQAQFATSVEPVVPDEEVSVSYVRGAFIWTFLVLPSGEFRCVVEYEPDAIDATTVQRWGTEFIDLIQAIADRPDQTWKRR